MNAQSHLTKKEILKHILGFTQERNHIYAIIKTALNHLEP